MLKPVLRACLAPLLFSLRTGHARSALWQRPMDRDGRPIPWLTYPVIDLLSAKDLTNRRILEFGAGQSTLWWARRGRDVVSFEDSPSWHAAVVKQAPTNVRVYLVGRSLTEAPAFIQGERFDIVLVDGLDRAVASRIAKEAVTLNGAVILDNSEKCWGGAEGTYPIMDLFRTAGFQRVDFFGLGPAMLRPHCTSMFFRNGCFLFEGTENPIL